VDLFCKIRGVKETRARFEWLYRANPAGEARVWILQTSSGKPVGFTAGFPREVWVCGERKRALVCGDFSIETAHRTLGPAVMLRRAVKVLIDGGEYALLYAHPSPRMLAVHGRVGHPQLSSMMRWVQPLRARNTARARLGPLIGSLVTPALNLMLTTRRWLQCASTSGLTVQETSSLTDEYDALDAVLGTVYPVIGCRGRAHLTWRFLECPKVQVTILEARDGARQLVGYLVLQHDAELAAIHDLAYLPGSGADRALVATAVRRVSDTRAENLIFVVPREYPGRPALRSAGFWERSPELPIVCYAGQDLPQKAVIEAAESWYMTVGDRDVYPY